MTKPTMSFEEWYTKREALFAQGDRGGGTRLANEYTIIGYDGTPLNPEPVVVDDGFGPGGRREARVKSIIEMAGVSRTEAQRRVMVADGDLPVERMTSAERDEHIKSLSPTVMGLPDPNAPADTRTPEAIAQEIEADAIIEKARNEKWRELTQISNARMEAAANKRAADRAKADADYVHAQRNVVRVKAGLPPEAV